MCQFTGLNWKETNASLLGAHYVFVMTIERRRILKREKKKDI
jgi:hypothetical protein